MKRCIKWFSITFVLLLVSMRLVFILLPAPSLLAPLSYSRAVYDDHHRLLRLTLSQDGKYRLFTPLKNIPSVLIKATLLQEDQYFYWHPGINPLALMKAAWETYVLHARRMGASTISMQVARMRFGIHSKTFMGKVQQIFRALEIESKYSKNKILEAYFNLAPYGNNIEGVGAASLLYFNTSVDQLRLPEALTLAVIPQNPNKRIPDRGELKSIRNKLFVRWIKHEPRDQMQQDLMELPLQIRNMHKAPFYAPHFVDAVLAHEPQSSYQIQSALNLPTQHIIEKAVNHYLQRKANLGVNNAAVMLIDTRNMGIKAMVGSADFFNRAIGGQINGTDVYRSPGSTLKPFIYGLAIDQGLIHPGTVLKDVPRSFGSYNPENFDNDFMGPIKAKEALILSRNIPAVYLADLLKHPTLYEFLQQAGVHHLKSEAYYGLALVLGGGEMSMQELATLYAVLANGGELKPLRWTMDSRDALTQSSKLLSPEASFLVLDMMKDTPPPLSNFEYLTASGKIAWKTGTSSGYRDAWTIGIVGPYVLAVWVGNFNNKGNPSLIGKDMAAPLFFEIASATKPLWENAPSLQQRAGRLHLTKVDVCKASGMLPTRYCSDTESVWFIPGISPIKTDNIYREVAINRRTGLRACRFDQNTQFAIFEFWPSDLLKVFHSAGIQRNTPPAFDVACTFDNKVSTGIEPQIVSPQTRVSYITPRGTESAVSIPFAAVVDADVRHVYWFLNNIYLGKSDRDQPFIWHAVPGKYVIRAVDDYGRADARDLTVTAEG